jgi:putative ABC transport system substrate-binding protein
MGFVDGRNVAIEYRYAEDRNERLPALAAELVRGGVAVIFASGGAVAVPAAKASTTTIPIVFITGADPVETGMVTSFNRPGGHVTGFSSMSTELTAKRLGLLHALLPTAARIAVLVNPGVPRTAASVTAHAQASASTIGRQIEVFTASTSGEIDAAFASMVQKRADALLIATNAFFSNRQVQLATLAARHALPAIHTTREFVEAGGLMSYGASQADMNRQGGIYVGRILKGEKAADLPVMQPTKFEFVLNLQTARALGIEVPPTLLALADEVIE